MDPKAMEPMAIITPIQQTAELVSAVPQIIQMCPKKEWPTIKDRYGGRVWREMSARPQDRIVA